MVTNLAKEILDNIACPRCHNTLHYTKEEMLVCVPCRVCYPIFDGVADLSPEVALPLSSDGKITPRKSIAVFSLEAGPDVGLRSFLEPYSCRAIGRKIEDTAQTQVFTVDFNMSLDDHTRKLIRNYIAKRDSKKNQNEISVYWGELGSYKRLSDIVLNDPGVSRLHAMFFYDELGAGILDLVSRNGTFVNGKEVETCYLKSGDEIRLGNTLIRFSLKS